MAKKLIIIAVIVIMLFGVFGLTGCEVSLDDYKADAKATIQAHADAKGEENYCEDNWQLICKAVTDGMQAVQDASTKLQVDTAVVDAKTVINAIERQDVNLEWTNSNAVYAFVKAGFESDILSDIEGSFETLSFQKVYVTEKNISISAPFTLLFVLNESGAEKQQEFRKLLNQDTRISHSSNSRDLFFEAVDTRYIDKVKDTIAVGETLTLEVKGSIDYYVKPFSFKGFLVKPLTSKTYTVADFPQVDLKSVDARDNGWLYLELATEGYFEVIKAANTLSRLSAIEQVELDKSENFPIPPPIWVISDYSVVVFESTTGGGYPTAVLKGIKVGKVTVDFDGVICEITVT